MLFRSPPKDTTTTQYVRVANSSGDSLDCDTNCNSIYSNYEIYKRESYVVKQGVRTCLEYADIRVVPIYSDIKVTKYRTEVVTEPIYGYVNKKITFYRSRTRKLIAGTTSIRWSQYNDRALLNAGYSYTGRRNVK